MQSCNTTQHHLFLVAGLAVLKLSAKQQLMDCELDHCKPCNAAHVSPGLVLGAGESRTKQSHSLSVLGLPQHSAAYPAFLVIARAGTLLHACIHADRLGLWVLCSAVSSNCTRTTCYTPALYVLQRPASYKT